MANPRVASPTTSSPGKNPIRTLVPRWIVLNVSIYVLGCAVVIAWPHVVRLLNRPAAPPDGPGAMALYAIGTFACCAILISISLRVALSYDENALYRFDRPWWAPFLARTCSCEIRFDQLTWIEPIMAPDLQSRVEVIVFRTGPDDDYPFIPLQRASHPDTEIRELLRFVVARNPLYLSVYLVDFLNEAPGS